MRKGSILRDTPGGGSVNQQRTYAPAPLRPPWIDKISRDGQKNLSDLKIICFFVLFFFKKCITSLCKLPISYRVMRGAAVKDLHQLPPPPPPPPFRWEMVGIIMVWFCYDNRENRQWKDNQSSSAASLTPLFTPSPKERRISIMISNPDIRRNF